MPEKKEEIFNSLIKDYLNSIESLKSSLKETEDIDTICKISQQIEGYQAQIKKLEHLIK